MSVATEERLDEVFGALANTTRRAILVRLVDGEASVNELAEPFDISLPAISRHLKVLEDARLIERSRRAQYRPCRLAPEPLAAVAAWTEQYRPIWEERLDRLEAALTTDDDRASADDTPEDTP